MLLCFNSRGGPLGRFLQRTLCRNPPNRQPCLCAHNDFVSLDLCSVRALIYAIKILLFYCSGYDHDVICRETSSKRRFVGLPVSLRGNHPSYYELGKSVRALREGALGFTIAFCSLSSKSVHVSHSLQVNDGVVYLNSEGLLHRVQGDNSAFPISALC